MRRPKKASHPVTRVALPRWVAVAWSSFTSPSEQPAAARRNAVVTRATTGTHERWTDRDTRAMDGQCGRSREPNRCSVVMVINGRDGQKVLFAKRKRGSAKRRGPCMTNHAL